MHFYNTILPRIIGGFLILCLIVGFAPVAFAATSVNKTVGESATISWNAPRTYTNGSIIPSTVALTYNIYKAAQAQGSVCAVPPLTKPVVSGYAALKWTTPAYTVGGTMCYVITAIANNVESAPSVIVTVNVKGPTPNPPQPAVQ